MQIFTNVEEWMAFRRTLSPSLRIGFIPTMGNLHAGHASLFLTAKHENDIQVASVFVNPAQFNQADDFRSYPRTLESDYDVMERSGIDYCLLPTEPDIYPDNYRYRIVEQELCQIMEGVQRPGHFNGVLTVVLKLLNLVRPHHAYFGEKDYQQYLLIRDMVRAFFMDIIIRPCPTIRESDGLACSSRNTRLNAGQRLLAGRFAHIFHQDKPCKLLICELQKEGIEVDYLLDYEGRRFAAVAIGNVRLIDNKK